MRYPYLLCCLFAFNLGTSAAFAAEVSFKFDCVARVGTSSEQENRMTGTMTFRDDPSLARMPLPIYLAQNFYSMVLTVDLYQARSEKSTFSMTFYENAADGSKEISSATSGLRLDGRDQLTVTSQLLSEKDTISATCNLVPSAAN